MNVVDEMMPGQADAGRILIVEDEQVVALDIETKLTHFGYRVAGNVMSGEEAIESALKLRPDLILMDIRLSGKIDGIQAAEIINKEIYCPVIFLTAYSDDTTLTRAKQATPFGYLVKPFKAPDLRCMIDVALHKHRRDAQLREQKKWFFTLLHSMGDAVVATDHEGRIKYLNPVAETLTGWTNDEVSGRQERGILSFVDENNDGLESPIHRALQSGEVQTLGDDARLVAKTGHKIPIDDSASPIKDERGTVLGGVMVFRDASERWRKDAEVRSLNADLDRWTAQRTAALMKANIALERASRMKSDFLCSLSHEFRSPLNAIIGFSELFNEGCFGALSPQQQDAIQAIGDGGSRLLALVNDFLDPSVIMNEPTTLSPNSKGIHDLLQEALCTVSGSASQKQIELRLDCPDLERLCVKNWCVIKQIVCDLLGNAVKFTPAGGMVEVSARRVRRDQVRLSSLPEWDTLQFPLPDNAFEEFLEIKVSDNGIGIASCDLPHLFQDVVQNDASSTRPDESADLGLMLIKYLCELHGGAVAVESKEGLGSCFTFWLPWQTQDRQPQAEEPALLHQSPLAQEAHCILVVEDAPDKLMQTVAMLQDAGHQVIEATTAQQGIDLARERHPDLIFMDIGLPDMSGLEATQLLKKDSQTRDIPIVALTAFAFKGGQQQILEAGCDGYIAKPIRLSKLQETLQTLRRCGREAEI